jgi:hypothetical protein
VEEVEAVRCKGAWRNRRVGEYIADGVESVDSRGEDGDEGGGFVPVGVDQREGSIGEKGKSGLKVKGEGIEGRRGGESSWDGTRGSIHGRWKGEGL